MKTFKQIKEDISEGRAQGLSEAKDRTQYRCLRSRGSFLYASDKEGERLDREEYNVSTYKALLSDIAHLKSLGAVEFQIGGGFDAAERVGDWAELDYIPLVSEWVIDLDVN